MGRDLLPVNLFAASSSFHDTDDFFLIDVGGAQECDVRSLLRFLPWPFKARLFLRLVFQIHFGDRIDEPFFFSSMENRA